MNTQTPPPSGAELFQAVILWIRDSKWMQLLRTYQTLALAIVCVLVAAILGLISQPKTDVTATQTVQTEMALGSITPLVVEPATEQATQIALATPDLANPTATGALIGPVPPGQETPSVGLPTSEVPSTYPLPGDPQPTGIGGIPTVPPFPTPFTPVAGGTIPTFDNRIPFPTVPSNTGQNSGRATDTPSSSNNTYPTEASNPTSFVPPTNIPVPTDDPNQFPTDEPNNPAPTDAPEEATLVPTDSVPPTDAPPTNTPTPTVPPYDTLRGNVRWTAAQSPVIVRRDTVIPKGASLTIEDGVEVQMAPDVSLSVDGTLTANGTRFRKQGTGNWESIVVTKNGRANLNGVDVRGGGSGGVVIAALGGSTVIQDSRFEDNKGKILADGGDLDMQRNSIVGYAPITANVVSGGTLRMIGNVINNTATDGASGVTVSAASPDVTINVEGNALRGTSGTNLRAQFNQSLNANFTCNTFSGGAIGLQIKSTDPTLDGSRLIIKDNNFLTHKSYGATGDVGLDVRNNWWGDASGPYHPQQNGKGTGDAVGINLTFSPWLTNRSTCAP